MSLAAGARLGPYEIVAPLGAGGMGEVYRARDTRLGREVAIKVLPAEVATDPERRKRFEQEARAVSSLSHPGIVTLFEIESAAGPDGPIEFLAMELVPGEPLNRRIPSGGFPVAVAVDFALQAAEALAAAHEAGVVHRDLKPANLIVMPSGRLKVLDFGLARLRPTTLADPEAPTVADSSLTRVGSILGTLGYLSPEQAAGERADERSDLFSLGVVLYEMLSGVSPFARDSPMRSLAAVLQEPAPPLVPPHGALPPRLGAIVARCLAKEPAARYPSAAALADDLRAVRLALEVPARSAGTIATRSPLVRFAAIALALGVGSLAVVWFRGADERWLARVALPGIEKRLDDDKRFDAFLLAREAARRVPDDARLAKLVDRFTIQASIASEPAGATVSISDYVDPRGVWQQLGTTPLAEVRVPDLALRFRLEKPGFDPIESAPVGRPGDDGRLSFEVALTPAGQAPAGMVRVGVRTAEASFRLAEPVIIEPFWLDRLEVSNRDYQRFVDDGGYARRELWREPFVDGEKALSWEEATAQFRDATGRPGPAGWELGRYPEGKADLPVGGVSWYEASAYAAWAGKSLPTFHHWYLAASPDIFSEIVQLSNFDGDGPRPVGKFAGLGPWGTLDMAGNIKEWVSTASGEARYLLGGGWSDPSYLYAEPDRALPMARDPAFGFRCARYDRQLEAAVSAPVAPFARDFTREQPVDDPLFAALTSVYSYDRAAPLGARQEPGGEEGAAWRLERFSIAPVTGDERLPIRLYLPKSGRAPYSTVIFFPDSSAEAKGISEQLEHRYFEFLLRSGRAVAFPVFANTYERRKFGWTAVQRQIRRDLVITWTKELSRTIDYLQTRPDLDPKRVALYGFSLGAVYAPIFAALEPRLATTIILGGGFPTRPTLPEADPFNFAPRVRMPVLMIAGRDDFVRPLESQQRPLFERLGTSGERKRLAVLDGGHLPPKMNEIVREILDWLDQWLGPANG